MTKKISQRTAEKSASPVSREPREASRPTTSKSGEPPLLSGGNPQIPKGYGDEPVRAYIAAMPGWKRAVGERLDKLIVQAVPNVEKAVKWNSPFYGTQRGVWFLGFHCLTKYVKVAFFQGAHLNPQPSGASKQKDVRYLDVYEDDDIDDALFVDWVRQASKLPGERM